jgi:haloacetate dehalogenase
MAAKSTGFSTLRGRQRVFCQWEEFVERRTPLTAASAGSLVVGPLAQLANAQPDSSSTSFKIAEIDVAGNKVFYRRYGQGPAILMVHGFPRTSLMWRFLAPKLAGNHTVVCVDLRGCGRPLSVFQARHGKGTG